jgi:hypothetical protein
MTSDRKIFIDEAPGWLWRAIRAQYADARIDGDGNTLQLLALETGQANLHRPTNVGVCLGCLPDGTMPWPCRQAGHLLRRHRGEVGWRPHWDELIEGEA